MDHRTSRLHVCGRVTTIGRLHDGELLSDTRVKQFGEILWRRTGEDGMPADTHYYRHAFLRLPCPAHIDAVGIFMRYVRGARFPAQKSVGAVS